MRVLLQRVQSAFVTVDGQMIGQIERGYVLFVGVMRGDTGAEAEWLMRKVVNLRLFEGEDHKVNDRSLIDIGGHALVISQFTLAGAVEKGNRPDYTMAEAPTAAETLYEQCIRQLREMGVTRVEQGVFGAHMQVSLINDGPVTLLLERVPMV